MGHKDIPSIHLPGTKTHPFLPGTDPVTTWEIGKFQSSLPLCCLEEEASCSPLLDLGTAHSRVCQTSCLLSMSTVTQWSSHLQEAAGLGRGSKVLLAHPFHTFKMLTWGWGANTTGEVEAHPYTSIQIPFKDWCPTSPNHIKAALCNSFCKTSPTQSQAGFDFDLGLLPGKGTCQTGLGQSE